MSDKQLERRIAAILTRLQLLSDGDSASIVANETGHAKPDSSPPPGARPDLEPGKPPPKDRSLYEWYSWHFDRALNDDRRRLLCYLAERDYARVVHKPPQPRGKTGPEDERTGMKRIVEWYEGVDALEVAVLEGINVHHVYKARRVHRRRTHDGTHQSEWMTWDDNQRQLAVRNRLDAGHSQNRIARDLEVSRRTIQRYVK